MPRHCWRSSSVLPPGCAYQSKKVDMIDTDNLYKLEFNVELLLSSIKSLQEDGIRGKGVASQASPPTLNCCQKNKNSEYKKMYQI
jgi:hypothetical protein